MKHKYKVFIVLFLTATCLYAQNRATYTYAIKNSDSLKLDVYTPANVTKGDSLPVVVWMHGGGFAGGRRDQMEIEKFMNYLSIEKGYIGVSISYRLLRSKKPTGFGCDCTRTEKITTFKEAAIDYLDATAFLVEHAEELHLDPSRIIAGGSSAGAEGILNAVFMRSFFVSDLERYKNVQYAGVFSCAGAVLNANYITENNAVPSVLFHGTKDPLVPFDTAPHHYCDPEKPGFIMLDGSNQIADKLMAYESSLYYTVVNGGGHELAAIPFQDLDRIMSFFQETITEKNTQQLKFIKTKK